MPLALITGEDETVGWWLFQQAGAQPRPFDLAIGLQDDRGALVGGFMFTDWNGESLEAHFWGPGALRAGVVRSLFRLALDQFNASTVIVKASREHMARGCQKLGASLARANLEFGEWHFSRPLIEKLSRTKEV